MSIQAYCYWCNDPIYGNKTEDVKTYWYCTILNFGEDWIWNKGYVGFPICNQCLGNFRSGKTIKQIKSEIDSKLNSKKGLDKWIRN